MTVRYLLNRVRLSLHYRFVYASGVAYLYRLYQSIRIKQIRKKSSITVLFIVGEASTWKSELLYRNMLNHPRFAPILGITESLDVPGSKALLIDYAKKMGYDYVDLDKEENSISKLNPDIKFYYKPYENNYRRGLYFDYNLRSLVCSIHYGFNQGGDAIAFKHEIRRYSWRDFVENKAVIEAMKDAGKYYGNKVVTGLPIQDMLSLPKEYFKDPWRGYSRKKRIIYAPHHSFKGSNGSFIEYATFLTFGDYMLEMAQKYAEEVQWVFKPHPSLRVKLIKIWGEERTNKYYQEWENLSNAQVELGAYYDIFKYSDAMIHDCCSFIIEYLYTGNPVLFLEYNTQTAAQMHLSGFGYDAYKSHYHASSKEQIEGFILNVINGNDSKKQEREAYFDHYLRLPYNKSACENIMDVILG